MSYEVNDEGVIVVEFMGHRGFFDHQYQADNWMEAIMNHYEYLEEEENDNEDA
tara:strand:+ start:83 stop:241 length:159 start_codon:yes stop_codon:yes gene_type:complete